MIGRLSLSNLFSKIVFVLTLILYFVVKSVAKQVTVMDWKCSIA